MSHLAISANLTNVHPAVEIHSAYKKNRKHEVVFPFISPVTKQTKNHPVLYIQLNMPDYPKPFGSEGCYVGFAKRFLNTSSHWFWVSYSRFTFRSLEINRHIPITETKRIVFRFHYHPTQKVIGSLGGFYVFCCFWLISLKTTTSPALQKNSGSWSMRFATIQASLLCKAEHLSCWWKVSFVGTGEPRKNPGSLTFHEILVVKRNVNLKT